MRVAFQQRLPFTSTEIDASRAAKMLHCSVDSIYRYLDEGLIEGYRLKDRGWWHVYYDSVVRFSQLRRGILPEQPASPSVATETVGDRV